MLRVRRWLRRNWAAWKAGLTVNIFLALFILVANVAFPSWAMRRYGVAEGFLYHGDCDKAKHLGVVAHGIINTLGTLLLSASNYTMQILSAPTREEIDHAHKRGQTLSVGIQSFTNLRFVGNYRKSLWLSLALSSIPLHLIYNSLVFLTTGKHSYLAAVVSPDFLHGAPFDTSLIGKFDAAHSEPSFSTGKIPFAHKDMEDYGVPSFGPITGHVLDVVRKKAQENLLNEMTSQECLDTYSSYSQVTYRNVLAVSEEVRSDTSVVWIDQLFPNNDDSTNWTCMYSRNAPFNWGFMGRPACGNRTGNATDWSLGLYLQQTKVGSEYMGSHRITRCLSEPIEFSLCSLRYDKRLLLIVIAMNLVKLLAMTATLCQYKRPSLVTVGDGLASFLRSPDPSTKGMCLAKEAEFACDPWPIGPRAYIQTEVTSSRLAGASYRQWAVTIALSSLSVAATLIAFIKVYQPVNFQWSFTDYVEPGSIRFGQGLNVGALIVIANIPQLLVSFNYIIINRLVTCMAASREWSLHAHQRKGLRTSTPTGAQRSTFWLQLPFKLSLPLMAMSAGLHYLVSQSLYFGSVQFYAPYDDENGVPVISEDITGLGYSHDAAYILTITIIVFVAGAISWGRLQNKPGIPPSRFSSAMISASCHPPDREEDVHLKPVQWGEVKWGSTATDIGHCSFSSDEVMMPVEGREYM